MYFSPKIFWYTVGKENGRIFGIRHFYLAGYPTKSISCPTLFCLGAYMKSPVTLLIIFTKFAYSAATSTLVWSFIGLLNFSGLQELVFPTWYLLYSRSQNSNGIPVLWYFESVTLEIYCLPSSLGIKLCSCKRVNAGGSFLFLHNLGQKPSSCLQKTVKKIFWHLYIIVKWFFKLRPQHEKQDILAITLEKVPHICAFTKKGYR